MSPLVWLLGGALAILAFVFGRKFWRRYIYFLTLRRSKRHAALLDTDEEEDLYWMRQYPVLQKLADRAEIKVRFPTPLQMQWLLANKHRRRA